MWVIWYRSDYTSVRRKLLHCQPSFVWLYIPQRSKYIDWNIIIAVVGQRPPSFSRLLGAIWVNQTLELGHHGLSSTTVDCYWLTAWHHSVRGNDSQSSNINCNRKVGTEYSGYGVTGSPNRSSHSGQNFLTTRFQVRAWLETGPTKLLCEFVFNHFSISTEVVSGYTTCLYSVVISAINQAADCWLFFVHSSLEVPLCCSLHRMAVYCNKFTIGYSIIMPPPRGH